jgi:hypothetical protein
MLMTADLADPRGNVDPFGHHTDLRARKHIHGAGTGR